LVSRGVRDSRKATIDSLQKKKFLGKEGRHYLPDQTGNESARTREETELRLGREVPKERGGIKGG